MRGISEPFFIRNFKMKHNIIIFSDNIITLANTAGSGVFLGTVDAREAGGRQGGRVPCHCVGLLRRQGLQVLKGAPPK